MRKAKSPYQRHGKTPYRYSDAYRHWRAAITAGRSAEAEAMAHTAMCTRAHGPMPGLRQRRIANA